MKRLLFLMTVVMTMSLPRLTQAQWAAAPHVIISVPTSDFANVSGTGGGFGVKVTRDVGGRDGFGLRGDFSFLSHGREFTTVIFSGFPVLSEVRQQSLRLGVGPQYVFGSRNLKFQLGATGGFYIFRTTIDINTSFGFFQDESSDAAVGWKIGGGLQYDLGIGPWLDLSFEYNTIYNITTESTAETGQDEFETTSTDITANEFIVKVGVIFFLR